MACVAHDDSVFLPVCDAASESPSNPAVTRRDLTAGRHHIAGAALSHPGTLAGQKQMEFGQTVAKAMRRRRPKTSAPQPLAC